MWHLRFCATPWQKTVGLSEIFHGDTGGIFWTFFTTKVNWSAKVRDEAQRRFPGILRSHMIHMVRENEKSTLGIGENGGATSQYRIFWISSFSFIFHIYIYMYTHINIYIFICVYICMYIYIYTYNVHPWYYSIAVCTLPRFCHVHHEASFFSCFVPKKLAHRIIIPPDGKSWNHNKP